MYCNILVNYNTQTHTHTHTCTPSHIYTHTCTHLHTRTHTHTHTPAHTCTHLHTQRRDIADVCAANVCDSVQPVCVFISAVFLNLSHYTVWQVRSVVSVIWGVGWGAGEQGVSSVVNAVHQGYSPDRSLL